MSDADRFNQHLKTLHALAPTRKSGEAAQGGGLTLERKESIVPGGGSGD